MADPVLHVLAGPNGAGKSTFHHEILEPATGLPFVNADMIAADRWPDATVEHAYQAAQIAADARDDLIDQRRSFATETVFSHPSKVALIDRAQEAEFIVVLHVLMIPEELAVARVAARVEAGGHSVPEAKIRSRHRRLWGHIADAIVRTDETYVYDNSRASTPFQLVATFIAGHPQDTPTWPAWTPQPLRQAAAG